MAYSAVSSYLGFGGLGIGKVMGLAPYGKEDPNIKSFILDDGYTVDSNLFYRTRFGANFIPYDYLALLLMLFLITDALERTNMRNLVLKHRKTFSKNICLQILYLGPKLETSRRFSNSHVISSHRCT